MIEKILDALIKSIAKFSRKSPPDLKKDTGHIMRRGYCLLCRRPEARTLPGERWPGP